MARPCPPRTSVRPRLSSWRASSPGARRACAASTILTGVMPPWISACEASAPPSSGSTDNPSDEPSRRPLVPLLPNRSEGDSADRYADGRFDYLAARALAATGRRDEAIALFERHVSADDLLDVPARLAAGTLRFEGGDGAGALELLFPLLQRKGGAVSRRALRIALDAL